MLFFQVQNIQVAHYIDDLKHLSHASFTKWLHHLQMVTQRNIWATVKQKFSKDSVGVSLIEIVPGEISLLQSIHWDHR